MKADFILGFSVWLNWYWEVRFKSNLSLLLTTCGELMCSYFCDTTQVYPYSLGRDIHVTDGHSRIYI